MWENSESAALDMADGNNCFLEQPLLGIKILVVSATVYSSVLNCVQHGVDDEDIIIDCILDFCIAIDILLRYSIETRPTLPRLPPNKAYMSRF